MAFRSKRAKLTARDKIDATPPWEQRHRDEPEPTTGPYDVADAPEDDVQRIDLGAVRVPVRDGVEVRLEMNESHQVIAVTLANPDGHMQLGVFAAPRNEGIWGEVRTELSQTIRDSKGSVRESDEGLFGPELHAVLAGQGGPGDKLPARFLGVDGPRWFLRAMLVGDAATDPAKAGPFEQVLRDVVVVRGTSPMPVREPVPLQPPKELLASIEAGEFKPNPN